MKKRKVLYISGTRADYGLMKETLLEIKNNPSLRLEIIVTGMHLMPEFGKTIEAIKKDRFKITAVKAVYKEDDKQSMAFFLGNFLQLLTKAVKRIKPDIILLLGDRAEMLAGAIAGAYLSIPVAHIHGGDISSTVDNSVRNAITKLAHIHFPATKKSAEKIIKMGEKPWRVHISGAPGLNHILKGKKTSPLIISKKYSIDISKPFLLVVQHPVSTEEKDASNQIKETMEAISELGFQSVVIYPNADAGGRRMIKVIEQYRKYLFIRIYKNIVREDYLGLMNIAGALIGNSSSGIIEAPSFFLPVINIGNRQKGRERAENIIDVGYNREEIKKAIKKAFNDKHFAKKVKSGKNPYSNGGLGKIISKTLCEIKISKKLLEK